MSVAVCTTAPEFPTYSQVWAAIQSQQNMAVAEPLYNRYTTSTTLTKFSLEACTESLGSETGSDAFFSDLDDCFSSSSSSSSDVSDAAEEEEEDEKEIRHDVEKLVTVNYHCSISKKSPVRSFPPPLPSISRRDGPCLSVRPHRRDGRLVMEAVTVPSQNYLHAERHNGRLLLSFVHSTANRTQPQTEQQQEAIEEDKACAEAEEEEEEEVEVVDRGTVVELKMSTQPHRSSFVINKFVGGLPAPPAAPPSPPLSYRETSRAYEYEHDDSKIRQTPENKMLFMSKGRNRGELLHRCSHLWRPLLFWEPYCIATSS